MKMKSWELKYITFRGDRYVKKEMSSFKGICSFCDLYEYCYHGGIDDNVLRYMCISLLGIDSCFKKTGIQINP